MIIPPAPDLPAANAVQTVAIGIGQYAVTRELDTHLITYGLGSCIGVAAWDPQTRIGGMLHILLPEPPTNSANPSKDAGAISPARFAMTGVPLLIQQLAKAGAATERLRVVAAGGARMLGVLSNTNSVIGSIGERNAAIVVAQLQAQGIRLIAQEFGGTQGRTLGLEIATGAFWIRIAGAQPVSIR